MYSLFNNFNDILLHISTLFIAVPVFCVGIFIRCAPVTWLPHKVGYSIIKRLIAKISHSSPILFTLVFLFSFYSFSLDIVCILLARLSSELFFSSNQTTIYPNEKKKENTMNDATQKLLLILYKVMITAHCSLILYIFHIFTVSLSTARSQVVDVRANK